MSRRVLVAESDPTLCHIYHLFLTRHGYDVDTAADGLECVGKLRRNVPAVLVLDRDLMWGGPDGVLAWLREEMPAAGTAVVLLATGSRVPGEEEIEPPVVSLLHKPFKLQELLQQVRAAVPTGRGPAWAASDLPGFPDCLIG